jgi:hypothetical protein
MRLSPAMGVSAGRTSWPLVALLCGLPLWWVAGLFSFVPLFLSVPMAWQLMRMPRVHVPRGFGWWLLFLVWVALGLGVLWADAPGAETGGGMGRLLVFGYRAWWYAACTIVLLWIGNLSREALPDRRVLRLAGWVFTVTTLGGLLGVLRPEFEFRSLMELVLPGSLRHNGFIASLTHPAAAEIQSVLDRPEPRPKAPFPFTNSWGSALSLSLVFFLAAARGAGHRARIAAAVLLAAAGIPVLYSLNRGLWGSLLVGAVGLGVLLAAKRRPAVLAAMATVGVLAVVAATASPLGTLVAERMDHQHSNERRAQLLDSTVRSVTIGSPLVGFGSTRDVQGSFASIAGAATPDCPACGVPPLGTQGQLWLILFSQGWLGLAFFLIFVLLALSRCWRCRTTNQTVCTFVVLFFLIQLPVYDSLGLSLYLVMIALGLVLREEVLERQAVPARRRTLEALAARLRPALPVAGVLMVLGGGAGAAVAASQPPTYQRSVWIELAPAPVALDSDLSEPDATGTVTKTRDLTLDTESALLRSPQSLYTASRAVGTPSTSLDGAIEIGAVPNTRVLTVSVRSASRAGAVRDSDAIVSAYLDTRRSWLDQRRARLTTGLENELNQLLTSGPLGQRTRRYLISVMARLTSADTSPGTVVRLSPAERAPSRRPEAVTSGIALGLLAGCAWVNRTTRRRR